MVKYTVEYCRINKIYIETPTLEIFRKVVLALKCASVIRESSWEYYKELTYVGYYDPQQPCSGYNRDSGNIIISYKEFFRDNNININNTYELW
jgi:hypothetical protein